MADTARTTRIALLNDRCRQAPGLAGRWVATPGFLALPPALQSRFREAVETYHQWEEGNDPYGEHDFGAITLEGVKVFWKIDYFDRDLEYGSPDPADPRVTTRVLTLMLAEDY